MSLVNRLPRRGVVGFATRSFAAGSEQAPRGGGRGRGRGALQNFIQDNRPSSFGGPTSAHKNSSPNPSAGGRNQNRGRPGGAPGSFKAGNNRNGPNIKPKGQNTVFVVKGGQFDNSLGDSNAEGGGSTLEEMMDEVFELAYEQNDGILIIDYQATDQENEKVIAKFNQSNPRTLESLLQYENVEQALGGETLSNNEHVRDAWAIASKNPHILHAQRADMVQHMDKILSDLSAQNNGHLEYALTPPDDYMG